MSATPQHWRKSTRSSDNGQCVELACTPAGLVVRDSKNPAGPHLAFPGHRSLLAAVKAGHLG